MKKVLIILLVIMAVSGYSQGFHYSPAYYPVEIEMPQKYVPMTSTGVEYGTALPTWFEKHKKGLAVTGIQLVAVVLDAAGDAVYDMGKESGNSSQMTWGHTMQATAIAGMGVTLVSLSWEGTWWDGVRFGVGYVAMRYAVFDLSYNLTRGIDPLYADGVKAKMPPGGRAFTQALLFGFNIGFNLTEF